MSECKLDELLAAGEDGTKADPTEQHIHVLSLEGKLLPQGIIISQTYVWSSCSSFQFVFQSNRRKINHDHCVAKLWIDSCGVIHSPIICNNIPCILNVANLLTKRITR